MTEDIGPCKSWVEYQLRVELENLISKIHGDMGVSTDTLIYVCALAARIHVK